MTVDHVIPRSKGGTNDRGNLVTACERCNNAKSDSTEWFEGCVATEGHGDAVLFRETLLKQEMREDVNLEELR